MNLFPLSLLILTGCTTAPRPAMSPPMPKILFRPINIAEAAHAPEPSHPKQLPPLRYPPQPAHGWVLQESTDLKHWRNLAHFESPTELQCTAPPTGSRFFRLIGTSWPSEGNYRHLPGRYD